MNVNHLQQKLLAAARANPPSDRVPYAFEKRIMARLSEKPLADVWALWSRLLWRAALPCVAVALLICAWAFFSSRANVASNNLSQDFERTLLAAVEQSEVTQ